MKPKLTMVATLLLCLGLSAPTLAATKDSSMLHTAVNSCQGALPSFEGGLRKRPLGIVNEGAGTAFVTCGVTAHLSTSVVSAQNNIGLVDAVTLSFRNSGTEPSLVVSCTLANDQNPGQIGDEMFIAKSLTLAAGASNSIFWNKAENIAGLPFRLPGFSCALPSKFEIEQITTNFTVDVFD